MEIWYHPENREVLSRLATAAFDAKEWFDLKTAAERLSLLDGFDRLLSLETLDIQLFQHQEQAVRKVLQEMRGRAILADEVGLGKTIEAGVILKEYVLRGLVQRVLILVPASLVGQWRSELKEKLDLDFSVARTPRDFEAAKIVASIDTAKRPVHREIIQRTPWDLVIVDEAHRLRNSRTLNWKFVNGIQKKYLLLLTATPIQNDLRELYNLVTLLKPGQLKTFTQFKRAYMLDKHSPKNTYRLREALKEVLVRTSRQETLIPFPRRQVISVAVAMERPERAFYDETLALLRAAYRAMPHDKKNLLPLILVLRQCSSHPAIALATLQAMCRRGTLPAVNPDALASLNACASGLVPGKLELLLQKARSLEEPAIVYTEFRASQREIAKTLREAGLIVHLFHGGMTPAEREQAVLRFRSEGGIMVSTEAGGEGHNFQFCRHVINYDLPWNPMRIEQRIGRVHRLGQEREVQVINLVTEKSIDAYVLYLLEKKIGMFEKVIGEVDAILANVEASFEERLAHAALASQSDDEMKARIEAFGREIERASAAYERVKRLNAELLGS
jgi:Superfamily II DNA/RNA helicases, SNF2 family